MTRYIVEVEFIGTDRIVKERVKATSPEEAVNTIIDRGGEGWLRKPLPGDIVTVSNPLSSLKKMFLINNERLMEINSAEAEFWRKCISDAPVSVRELGVDHMLDEIFGKVDNRDCCTV